MRPSQRNRTFATALVLLAFALAGPAVRAQQPVPATEQAAGSDGTINAGGGGSEVVVAQPPAADQPPAGGSETEAASQPAAEPPLQEASWGIDVLDTGQATDTSSSSSSQDQLLGAPAAEAPSGWQFEQLPAGALPPAAEAPPQPPQLAIALPAPAPGEAAAAAAAPAQAPLNATGLPLPPTPLGRAAPPPPPPPRRLCWQLGSTDFKGGDLDTAGNSTCCQAPADCCNTCWATPGCGAWTFRSSDSVCWLKQPAGWYRLPRQAGLVSGLVTAVSLQDYNTSAALAASAAAGAAAGGGLLLGPDQQAPTPLKLPDTKTWQPAPAGAEQGQCMVLPNSNPKGAEVGQVYNTTLADCCTACAQEPACTAWVFCPDPAGCNNGFGGISPANSCGLRQQELPPGGINEDSIQWWSRGTAAIHGYPPGYTVPWTAGYVIADSTAAATGSAAPPAYRQGQCMYLPNRNAKGRVDRVFATSDPGECCAACAADPGCDVWFICPHEQGCDNGFGTIYPGNQCGLKHQDLPPNTTASEATLQFWARGNSSNYTVPYLSGYVVRTAPAPSSGGSSAGVIAGAIVGSLAAVALAAGLIWWRRRRRRRRLERDEDHPDSFGKKMSETMSELDAAWRNGKATPSQSSSPITGSTNDTDMEAGRGRNGSLPADGSGGIAELPFAAALLTSSDFNIEADPATGKPVLLGSGHFANVYRGSCGMEPAAVKVIKDPDREVDRQQLMREVAILKSCRSQHLVSFLGASMGEHEVVIVTELMSGGTLWRALHTGKVNWYRRGLKIAIDVARGLDYLHRRNIVHLDLKSPNVLLTEHGRAKVADVGLARMVPATQSYLSGSVAMGTWPWAAPEQLFGQRCTIKADIYAYGVLLWEISTGLAPVRGHMREVKVPEECPPVAAALIAACMSGTAEARPSAEQIINNLLPLVMAAGAAAGAMSPRGSTQGSTSQQGLQLDVPHGSAQQQQQQAGQPSRGQQQQAGQPSGGQQQQAAGGAAKADMPPGSDDTAHYSPVPTAAPAPAGPSEGLQA